MKPMSKVNKTHTFKRIIKLLFKYYPFLVTFAIFCIITSSVAAIIPDVIIPKVINTIDPLKHPVWSSIKSQIKEYMIYLIILYVITIILNVIYTQLMAYITQGFLSKLRIQMFNGMQNLPIKYFDTNKHGDIMSYYTNDIDAIRQLVSQSLPQLLRSALIVLSVFTIMLWYSLWMTLIVVVGVIFMIFVAKTVGGGSAKYFIKRQKSIGQTEAFVQEMMNGQKVVKVFNH